MFRFLFVVLIFIFSLNAVAEGGDDFPKSARQKKSESYGSIFDGEGGFTIFGNKKKDGASGRGVIVGVNTYLWQAALEVVQFMPLASTDFNGGVINTDWYEDSDFGNQMYKVNIIIKSGELSANALHVSVFKKKLRDGRWRDVKLSTELAQELEDKILTKAREMKMAQE